MSFTLLRLLTSKVVYHAVEQDQNIVNQFIVTVVRQGFGTYFDRVYQFGALECNWTQWHEGNDAPGDDPL
jgi:hypothetical protein